jgi:hypothetical protein
MSTTLTLTEFPMLTRLCFFALTPLWLLLWLWLWLWLSSSLALLLSVCLSVCLSLCLSACLSIISLLSSSYSLSLSHPHPSSLSLLLCTTSSRPPRLCGPGSVERKKRQKAPAWFTPFFSFLF